MKTELYDTPQPHPVTVRLSGIGEAQWHVRELSAFEIARHQNDMLSLAAALYTQEAVRKAVASGETGHITLHPMQLLAHCAQSIQVLLALSTGQIAENIEALAYESLPVLIAKFVEANAPFFIDWLRQTVEAQREQKPAA